MNYNPASYPTFRLYGDNILECENVLSWLTSTTSPFKLLETFGSIERPILLFEYPHFGTKFYLQVCPYYGGTGNSTVWNNDPLNSTFNEKPDAIISKVNEDGVDEKPLIAIEFCDALQAGNQAWQRFKRALDPIEIGIPYLYVLPIIGWERDPEGLSLKNPRYQSAQITLAQLSVSGKLGVASLQIYKNTPWAKTALIKNKNIPVDYEQVISENAAIEYLSGLIINSLHPNTIDLKVALKKIILSMLKVARYYSSFSNTHLPIYKNHASLNLTLENEIARNYAEAIAENKEVTGENALHRINFDDFLKSGALFYKDLQSKTSSPEFFHLFTKYFNFKNENLDNTNETVCYWVDPTDKPIEEIRKSIPLSYKSKKSEAFILKNKEKFKQFILELYPEIDSEIISWIDGRNKEFIVIPIYGYKPSGDSRPDRGLVPMIYALFPEIAANRNIVVIMYSKCTPTKWKNLVTQKNNELWNTIAQYSGLIIVDKTKSGLIIQ